MTLFQLVTLESPIKLTQKAKGQLMKWSDEFAGESLSSLSNKALDVVKDGWEGLLIGISLAQRTDDSYIVDYCERDLS